MSMFTKVFFYKSTFKILVVTFIRCKFLFQARNLQPRMFSVFLFYRIKICYQIVFATNKTYLNQLQWRRSVVWERRVSCERRRRALRHCTPPDRRPDSAPLLSARSPCAILASCEPPGQPQTLASRHPTLCTTVRSISEKACCQVSCSSTTGDWTTGRKTSHSNSNQLKDKWAWADVS